MFTEKDNLLLENGKVAIEYDSKGKWSIHPITTKIFRQNAWLFTITDEYLQKYSQPIIADELWILPLLNGKHVVWLDDTTGKCCHACGECHTDCGDYTILTPGEFSDMLRRLGLEYPGHLYFTAFKKTINKITINIDWRK